MTFCYSDVTQTYIVISQATWQTMKLTRTFPNVLSTNKTVVYPNTCILPKHYKNTNHNLVNTKLSRNR